MIYGHIISQYRIKAIMSSVQYYQEPVWRVRPSCSTKSVFYLVSTSLPRDLGLWRPRQRSATSFSTLEFHIQVLCSTDACHEAFPVSSDCQRPHDTAVLGAAVFFCDQFTADNQPIRIGGLNTSSVHLNVLETKCMTLVLTRALWFTPWSLAAALSVVSPHFSFGLGCEARSNPIWARELVASAGWCCRFEESPHTATHKSNFSTSEDTTPSSLSPSDDADLPRSRHAATDLDSRIESLSMNVS